MRVESGATVGPNEFQEQEKVRHLLEGCYSAISILGRGLMIDRLKQEPLGTDDNITLATFDLFTTITSRDTTAFGLFDRPAFDHARR